MPEEGLSPSEVGEQIKEHRAHHSDDAHRAIAIAEALLLAVVAVLAAWSGYSSAKWSSESRLQLAEASSKRVVADTAEEEADAQRNFDAEAFDEWFVAYAANNEQAMRLAEQSFEPQMRVAFAEWWAQAQAGNVIPGGPIAVPEYTQPEREQVAALEAEADRLFEDGQHAANTADDYVRTTLYLATVLFLVGISGHFRVKSARIGLVVVGAAIMAFAVAQILTLPRPPA
jgi:hypothetical protein